MSVSVLLKPYLPPLFGWFRSGGRLIIFLELMVPLRSDMWHGANLAHAPLLFVQTFDIYRALAYIAHGVYVIYSQIL